MVKAGEAVAEWNDGDVAQAGASTTKVLSGTYALEDGTALAGRRVDFTWAPNGDAVIAPQSSQPAGTTRDGNTSGARHHRRRWWLLGRPGRPGSKPDGERA